jgi:hypothetical protein
MSTDGSGERPLTRRELRALRDAEATAGTSSEGRDTTAEEEPPGSDSLRSSGDPGAPRSSSERPSRVAHGAPALDGRRAAPDPGPRFDAPRSAASVPRMEPRPAEQKRRRPVGRFAGALLAVLGLLVVLAGAGAAVSLTQGPRLSAVQVDPSAATEVSGSRVVLTANQALAGIEQDQVTVTPSVPFTVDAAGRMVGVRFTVPLDDDTEYTVSIDGAESVGGGPASDLRTSFRTPPAEIFLLQRDPEGDDTIFRAGLSGEDAVPVFAHEEIDDFRSTSTSLVVSVREGEQSALYVIDRDGEDATALTLPGDGSVTGLQVSDRGDLVGYTFTDSELTETSGRASVLFTASLRDPSAEPAPMAVDGEEPSIARWRFVPDSSALLLIDFDSELIVYDPEAESPEPGLLGTAFDIDAVSRGTYTAFITHNDSSVGELDLTTGEEQPLVEPDTDMGQAVALQPVPGGGSVREFVRYDDAGMPEAQVVGYVADDGTATTLLEAAGSDGLQQMCVSPSGRYVAALVAPDLTANPYDRAPQPLPVKLETHIIEIDTSQEVSVLSGFDISWCEVGPW